MGGWEQIRALKTLSFDYPPRGGGPPVRWEIMWPNQVRREKEDDFILLFDGSKAGFLRGFRQEDGTHAEPKLLPETEWKIMELDVAPYLPAFFYLPFEGLGKGLDGERSADLIKVQFPLGETAVYYIGTEDHLPFRIDFPGMDYSLYLGDFLEVEGVLVPHRFHSATDPTRVSIIEKVRGNVDIERARLLFPPEIS
jgi:hypothetical protein